MDLEHREISLVQELKINELVGGVETVHPSGGEGAVQNTDTPEAWNIEGWGAVYGNVDEGKDRIMPGALAESLGNRPVRFLWQHKRDEPLGRIDSLEESEQGLYFKAVMPKDDKFVADRVVPQIKIGAIDSFSIGYRTLLSKMVNGVRQLEKLDLFEISLVTTPMNPEAAMTGFKSEGSSAVHFPIDKELKWDPDGATQRWRNYTGALDRPNEEFSKGFLVVEDPTQFSGHKLPFVDIVGAQPVVALSALKRYDSTVVEALGVDYRTKKSVESEINKYYSYAGEDMPFEDGGMLITKDMLQTSTDRELERILRDGGRFSREASKSVVHSLQSDPMRDANGSKKGSNAELLEGITKFKEELSKSASV